MKVIASVALILVLFSGPALCFILACPAQAAAHACCPRGGSLAACPYDFLSTPSGAVVIHNWTGLAAAVPMADYRVSLERQGYVACTVAADGRNLHVLHRVLRI